MHPPAHNEKSSVESIFLTLQHVRCYDKVNVWSKQHKQESGLTLLVPLICANRIAPVHCKMQNFSPKSACDWYMHRQACNARHEIRPRLKCG
jgi:hypothetical protein